ncbi:MAG: hypothetical protein WKG00_35790 [Polyangiaceae bacterium]
MRSTQVPLRLPASRTITPPGAGSTIMWTRETLLSSSTTSASSLRPKRRVRSTTQPTSGAPSPSNASTRPGRGTSPSQPLWSPSL